MSCQAQPPYGRARLAAKALGVPGGSCSGTAVGRYTILTATHCVIDGANAITVDGELCEVWKIVNDGADHALLTISHTCPQKHTARIGKAPITGHEVFVWGNPGSFTSLLRICQVAGVVTMPPMDVAQWPALRFPATLLTCAIAQGDSGAAVFNRYGEVAGVISFGSGRHTFPPHLFAGALALNFTPAQLAAL
jgi:hypothetical protein